MTKYEKWYKAITDNGKTFRDVTTERHHILPKCLGGSNDADNLTDITPREHFVCHWLLTKIYPTGEEHWKMINAFRMMRAENPRQQRYKTKITSRVYARLKEEYAKLQSQRFSGKGNGFYGKNHTEEAKQKISQANKGRIQPLDEKEKQIQAMTGRKRAPFTAEWLAKLSESNKGERNGMFNKKHKESSLALMRQKALGRKQSEETIKKKADAIRGSKREKILCPHCQLLIAVNTYPRWHGDRCRSK